jgi:hypothetical protein
MFRREALKTNYFFYINTRGWEDPRRSDYAAAARLTLASAVMLSERRCPNFLIDVS